MIQTYFSRCFSDLLQLFNVLSVVHVSLFITSRYTKKTRQLGRKKKKLPYWEEARRRKKYLVKIFLINHHPSEHKAVSTADWSREVTVTKHKTINCDLHATTLEEEHCCPLTLLRLAGKIVITLIEKTQKSSQQICPRFRKFLTKVFICILLLTECTKFSCVVL